MTTSTDRVTPRPILLWFAEQMEFALRRNDHKGGWHEDEPQSLVDRIREEIEEMEAEACEYERPSGAIAEAANVANMAMMVADHFREGGPSRDQGHDVDGFEPQAAELRKHQDLVEALQFLPANSVLNFYDLDMFLEEMRGKPTRWLPMRECKHAKFVDGRCARCVKDEDDHG